jgi:hypothetical protein
MGCHCILQFTIYDIDITYLTKCKCFLQILKKQYNMRWMPSYTRHRTKKKEAKKHNTICVGHHYTQANTNNVNKYCIVFLGLFVFVLCLVYPILPVSLDCPFLISPSVPLTIFYEIMESCVL